MSGWSGFSGNGGRTVAIGRGTLQCVEIGTEFPIAVAARQDDARSGQAGTDVIRQARQRLPQANMVELGFIDAIDQEPGGLAAKLPFRKTGRRRPADCGGKSVRCDIFHGRMESVLAGFGKGARLLFQLDRLAATGFSQNDNALMLEQLRPANLAEESLFKKPMILDAGAVILPLPELTIQRGVRHVLFGWRQVSGPPKKSAAGARDYTHADGRWQLLSLAIGGLNGSVPYTFDSARLRG